jgi:tetratricopeptide (TPR) repeat protein
LIESVANNTVELPYPIEMERVRFADSCLCEHPLEQLKCGLDAAESIAASVAALFLGAFLRHEGVHALRRCAFERLWKKGRTTTYGDWNAILRAACRLPPTIIAALRLSTRDIKALADAMDRLCTIRNQDLAHSGHREPASIENSVDMMKASLGTVFDALAHLVGGTYWVIPVGEPNRSAPALRFDGTKLPRNQTLPFWAQTGGLGNKHRVFYQSDANTDGIDVTGYFVWNGLTGRKADLCVLRWVRGGLRGDAEWRSVRDSADIGPKQRQDLAEELEEIRRNLTLEEQHIDASLTPLPGSKSYFSILPELILTRSAEFIGRSKVLSELLQFARFECDASPLRVISGPPGCGKTSLIAKVIQEFAASSPIHHIVGQDQGRNRLRLILQSLVEQLVLKHGIPLSISDDEDVLKRDFVNLLSEVVRRGHKEIVLIDGIDEIETSASSSAFDFIPPNPPPDIRFLLSVRKGTLERVMSDALPLDVRRLEPLGIEDVRDILERSDIHLSVDQLLATFEGCAGNPLVLKLMISEYLRDQSISFEKLGGRLESLVRKVIARATKTVAEDTVFDILGLVHIAPGRLNALDLCDILVEIPARKVRNVVESLSELLVETPEGYAFFHKSVHDYLRQQFSAVEFERFHGKIVDWLEPWEQKRHPYTSMGLIAHFYQSRQCNRALDLIADSEYRAFLYDTLYGSQFFQQILEDWEMGLRSASQNLDEKRRIIAVVIDVTAQYFQYFHDNALMVRLRSMGLENLIEDYATETNMDIPSQALGWFLSGAIAYHAGEYLRADEKFAKAQSLVESVGGRGAPFRFRIYQFRGLAHQYVGKFDEALQLYKQSGEVSAQEGSALYQVFSLSCAGNTYAMMGRHEEAVKCKRAALGLLLPMEGDLAAHQNIFSRDHFLLNVASALTRLAESLLVLGQDDEARDLLKRAETIYDAVPVRDRYYLYFIQVISAAEIDIGELDRSEHRLWETLILARSDHSRGKSLRLLAAIRAKRYEKEPAAAEPKAVIAAFEEALVTLKKVDVPTEEMLCLLDYKTFLEGIGEEEKAVELAKLANDLADRLGVSVTKSHLLRDSRISIPERDLTAND